MQWLLLQADDARHYGVHFVGLVSVTTSSPPCNVEISDILKLKSVRDLRYKIFCSSKREREREIEKMPQTDMLVLLFTSDFRYASSTLEISGTIDKCQLVENKTKILNIIYLWIECAHLFRARLLHPVWWTNVTVCAVWLPSVAFGHSHWSFLVLLPAIEIIYVFHFCGEISILDSTDTCISYICCINYLIL